MDIEPAVVDALRAIVAGTPVDWTALTSASSEESLGEIVRDLKIVSRIANLHRTVPDRDAALISTLGAPSAHDLQASPTWGTLTLLERVGAGSFGEVYRAWDPRLEREVALKLLREPSVSFGRTRLRSVHEGRLLARVRHSNIVTVYGADVIDERVGIWMERPLNGEEAVAIALAVCRALGAVHRAGFVHRDVKAQNVMRDDDGRIVLVRSRRERP